MGFDKKLFESLMEKYQSGLLSLKTNIINGRIEPPDNKDIDSLPEQNSPEYKELYDIGYEAIQNGEVGSIVLAGGMATRFKFDLPKALYKIIKNKTFLELKVRDISKWKKIPLYIMTNFCNHDLIENHLTENNCFGFKKENIFLFRQYEFPRFLENGELFKNKQGETDFAARGHGDFQEALRESKNLSRFIKNGGKYLLFSNMDNLGARVNPAIIGYHIKKKDEMTIEVAEKLKGDKGGAPAKVNKRMQLVEGFSFPPDFDQDKIDVFNTATYVFSAKSLDKSFDLPWYVVDKKVGEQEVIQFEHLAGDMSLYLKLGFVTINRKERFLPVKSLDDVPYTQEILKVLYKREL